MGVMICLGQGGLRSLSASSLCIVMVPFYNPKGMEIDTKHDGVTISF